MIYWTIAEMALNNNHSLTLFLLNIFASYDFLHLSDNPPEHLIVSLSVTFQVQTRLPFVYFELLFSHSGRDALQNIHSKFQAGRSVHGLFSVRIRSFMYRFFQFYFFGGALPYNDNPYGVTSGSYFNRPIFRYQNGVLAKNCYPIGRYIQLSVQWLNGQRWMNSYMTWCC